MGIPDMDELIVTDSELDHHVREALKAAIQGNNEFYEQLLAVLHKRKHSTTEEVALLVTCLKAVTGAVSCMHIDHHKRLLGAILRMSLWDHGTDVMDALTELIVSLASSNGELLGLCLEMLLANFMPPSKSSYFVEFLKEPRGLAKKTQVLDRVHSTLGNIAAVVPLSPMRLEEIVRNRMSKMGQVSPLPYLILNVENMLRLEGSAVGKLFGSTIIASLVDRLVELDVEISWDEILHDDFQKGIFDLEMEELEVEAHADVIEQDCTELTKEALIQRFLSKSPEAGKLDSLMALTFEYLKTCFENGRLVQVFETLLHSFQKTILTAYKSKFAQFVIFYACSLDPETCGKMFVDVLVNIFLTSPFSEWRMSAVAYLASYLARAKFVPASFVAYILESVVNWCFLYCNNQDGGINPKARKVFYAGCQAIMYVLCFRMKQMIDVPRLKSQLLHMHIEDVLNHPLRPLQVCLPSIVEEFLRLAQANRVFSLPQSSTDNGLLESEHSRAFGGADKFDTFFPFDPCLLRKCDEFIRPSYVYWSMVRGTYDDEDEEGLSDDDDDVAEAYVNRHAMSNQSDEEEYSEADELDYSMDKMSITPKDLSHKFGGRMQQQRRFEQMPSKIRPSTSPESL
ncbi:uncharacterized protein LOC127244884 [Andrographis paniculata]|uniref:uncharacterized protein LOC127244884 n=1 Tax=Andrographis paniculata TaxID=175694 RepID=UPI0021E85E47|nr:uncharacterized protein LOC127244884 [Andrographis paniculata]